MKDAIIFGTSDEQLRREALAKDFNLSQLKTAALGYEQSRKSSGAIKQGQSQDEECRRVYTEKQVEEIVAKMQAGKFSFQQQKQSKNEATQKQGGKCPNCPPHTPQK